MGRPAWKKYAKLAIKSAVAVLVLWAVGRHVGRTWTDLKKHPETLRIEPAWIVAAGAIYLAGLTVCGVYFGKVMAASPSPIAMWPAVRAYLISHLGKYVPGKAMVVLMRVGLSVPYGARPATAAIATFYETLVMMASGALIAALGFGLGGATVQRAPLALAVGLSALFLVVVDPLVFPRISRLVTMPIPNVGPAAQPNITRRLLGRGLLLTFAGWVLLGLSQVAVIRAVTPSGGIPSALWIVVIASVALATVAGFVVAVLPGGLGVREGVLMATLTPAIGDERAVVAALALRLTWVVAEAAAAAVLTVVRPGGPAPALSPPLRSQVFPNRGP